MESGGIPKGSGSGILGDKQTGKDQGPLIVMTRQGYKGPGFENPPFLKTGTLNPKPKTPLNPKP